MWGIVPAAGVGSRIQPLAFSKELLPVGSRFEAGLERPCAVSEYLLERMVRAGADKICFVISPGKSDIMEYFGASYAGAAIAYVVQPRPAGLCDALFRAAPLIAADESVVVGLPDTIWFPDDALLRLADDRLSLLLFPVQNPEFFDAVSTDRDGSVEMIEVKAAQPNSRWVWGAFKMPGNTLHALCRLWKDRAESDEYLGTLVNAYVASGGRVNAVKAGTDYVDVGTLGGYRAAIQLLDRLGAGAAPRGRDSGLMHEMLLGSTLKVAGVQR
jgi:glucose-1-phosphate thymidylyltransferase